MTGPTGKLLETQVESDSVAHLIQGLRDIPDATRRAAAPQLEDER
jgi:hypothetical protein